jgi:hypothetical protein
MIVNFLWELRYSTRTLSRTPALTIALVLTIALGIASAASVDGFVRGLLAQDEPFPPDALASISRLLRTAATAVFVLACANVAAFLLARASARSKETAVRVAIGARRPQLIRQVVADSVLLSIIGAAAGGVLAYWIGRIVPAMLFSEDAEQMKFAADAGAVALIAAGCAAITIVCGLLPLIETRHDDPGAIMQRENSGPSRASLRIGTGLVVLQMAACTLLVISAGLLFEGYRSALFTSTGRRLADATMATVEALQMSSKSVEATAGHDYFADTARTAEQTLGARSIAWVATVPGNRPVLRSFEFERTGLPLRSFEFERTLFTARSGDSVILPPTQGRLFGTIDSGRCGGIVLSAEAARQLSSSRIIGRSIESSSGWSEIVGVVRLRDDAPKAVVFHYAPKADDAKPETEIYRVPQFDDAPRTDLAVNVVSRNYFDMLGLPIVAGKTFDDVTDVCRMAIVNEQAADLYFGGNAVGGAIIDLNGLRTTIVGVVASAKLRVAQRDVAPTVYFPSGQDFLPRMTMILETDRVSNARLRHLHHLLEQIRGGRPERIIVTTLDRHLSRTSLAPERITTVLVGASASVSLVLGLLGLYGVMSDAARRRRREFALRIALGARGPHVIGQVVAEGMRLVIFGTFAGMAGSLVVAQWIALISPATDGPSATIWLIAPLSLVIAVGIASVLPARKALAVDPLLIMRDE